MIYLLGLVLYSFKVTIQVRGMGGACLRPNKHQG